MSNLGCVWYIDTDKEVKEKYPVVYANKDYYVCKVPGCSEVKVFVRNMCYDIEAWERYVEDLGKEESRCFNGWLFLKSGEKLEEINDKHEIIRLKRKQKELERDIENSPENIKYYNNIIKTYKINIKQMDENIKRELRELENRKKELEKVNKRIQELREMNKNKVSEKIDGKVSEKVGERNNE